MAAELDPDARERLIEALAAAGEKPNISEVARRAGYSRMHVYRLMKDKTFLAMLERRKAELARVEGEARAKGDEEAKKDVDRALGVLREIMDSSTAEDRDRIAASKAILAYDTAKRAAKKPGPAAASPGGAPVVRVLPPQDSKAADAWLEAQG